MIACGPTYTVRTPIGVYVLQKFAALRFGTLSAVILPTVTTCALIPEGGPTRDAERFARMASPFAERKSMFRWSNCACCLSASRARWSRWANSNWRPPNAGSTPGFTATLRGGTAGALAAIGGAGTAPSTVSETAPFDEGVTVERYAL